MGTITDTAADVYRDYAIPTLPAAGENDPAKGGIRSLFALIDAAIAAIAAGLVADGAVAYTTLAALNADLAHGAGTFGIVYSDPTLSNNGIYIKIGASGSGSWTAIIFGQWQAAIREVQRSITRKAVLPGGPRSQISADTAHNIAGFVDRQGLRSDRFKEFYLGTVPRFGIGRTLMPVSAVWRDPAGNIIAYRGSDGVMHDGVSDATLEALAGSRTDANARISESLSAYGSLKGHLVGQERLFAFNRKLGGLAQGDNLQIDWAIIGTSWSCSGAVGSWKAFAARMIAKFGDAGLGYTGFGWPPLATNADPNSNMRWTPLVYSNGGGGGSWATEYPIVANNTPAVNSPDLGGITSSTAADRIQVNSNVASPALSAAILFFTGTANGVIRYRWNGGAWSANTNVQGTVGQLQTLALANLPGGTTWTLDIEVVSGTVRLSGVNFKNAGPGIRFHNLACSTSRAQQYAGADAANYEYGLAQLAPDHLTIMHLTNDRGTNRIPDTQYGVDLTTLATRFYAACPLSSLSIVMEWDVDFPSANYASALYSAAAEKVAAEQKAAFLDLQYAVGFDPSTYYFGVGAQNVMANAFHPNANGIRGITYLLAKFATPAISLI